MKYFSFKVLILMMTCTLGSSLSFAGQFKSLDFLHSISGSKTVAGQHNDRKEVAPGPSHYTNRIYQITGKYPALWGGDFEFDGFRIDSRQAMIDEAKVQWNKGALISLMWHACPPTVAEPCDWYKHVQSDLSDAQWRDLTTEGGNLNGIWKSRMDQIAVYLQELEDYGVEVLFRPYHEMNQGNFWWGGRPGANGTAKLFRMNHDYFTKVKGLTNLIWVWDVQDFGSLASDVNSYNPGNEYWDIAALDVYDKNDQTQVYYSASKYQAMVGIPGNDPIALGEVGKLPSASELQNQPLWTFFMGWASEVWKPEFNNTNQDIINLYNASNVITLDEMPGWSGTTPPPPPTSGENIAKGKPVTVSSTETGYGNEARFAVDGNNATRWSSGYSDPEWIYVDLGKVYDINRVKINWEAAYSTAYQVQLSNNPSDVNSWVSIYSTSAGNGGIDDLTGLSGSGRYLRVHGTKRSLQYGHSIWELEVYGKDSGTTPPNPDPTPVPCEGPQASSDDGNVAANTVDNNLGTRWSANGDGQWIYYCAGDNQIISGANIAFYNGNVRSALFDLEVSNDAKTWELVASGLSSSGNSLGLEAFSFPGKKARYIRYLGHGNTSSSWNSITEFKVITGAGEPPQPPPAGGLKWQKANLTQYESYPDPGSEECIKFNGCKWAGYFAFVEGKQPQSWVKANNIAAVHSKDAAAYKLKTLRLRQGTKQIDVKVYDMCSDSDCNGCCTANARENGLDFLIDIEKYTVQRFGSGSGIVEWSCLDCKK